MSQNPLRLLQRGCATYTEADASYLESKGRIPKEDQDRNRRLDPDQEGRILAELDDRPDERAFFVLALETAMRMRECYTLCLSQVAISKQTIHLESSKNGDNRQLPLTILLGWI